MVTHRDVFSFDRSKTCHTCGVQITCYSLQPTHPPAHREILIYAHHTAAARYSLIFLLAGEIWLRSVPSVYCSAIFSPRPPTPFGLRKRGRKERMPLLFPPPFQVKKRPFRPYFFLFQFAGRKRYYRVFPSYCFWRGRWNSE